MKELSSILTTDSSAFLDRVCLKKKKKTVKDWIIVIGVAKKVIVCFPMSLFKENIHLTVKVSIRYCEAV